MSLLGRARPNSPLLVRVALVWVAHKSYRGLPQITGPINYARSDGNSARVAIQCKLRARLCAPCLDRVQSVSLRVGQ